MNMKLELAAGNQKFEQSPGDTRFALRRGIQPIIDGEDEQVIEGIGEKVFQNPCNTKSATRCRR